MKKELVLKLWDIANLIAGFSAVQTMAFSFFALSQLKEELRLPDLLKQYELQSNVWAGVLIGTVLYSGAIIGCHYLAKKLMSNEDWEAISSIWIWMTIGRVFVVIFFGCLTTYAIIY